MITNLTDSTNNIWSIEFNGIQNSLLKFTATRQSDNGSLTVYLKSNGSFEKCFFDITETINDNYLDLFTQIFNWYSSL